MEKQQMLDGDPRPMCTSEGQSRPEVRVARWWAGEPGPVDGRTRSPPRKRPRPHCPPHPKPLRLQRQLLIPTLDHGVHLQTARPRDLERREAEPKAPAQEVERAAAALPAAKHHKGSQTGTDLDATTSPEVTSPWKPAPAAPLKPPVAHTATPSPTQTPGPLSWLLAPPCPPELLLPFYMVIFSFLIAFIFFFYALYDSEPDIITAAILAITCKECRVAMTLT
ncbi:uncharacterized protein LOC129151736 [Eptesicus fuscus]|uniref:uncharacterized protein LOC129151736 n=1 Tax=Eptesicus fuscus TaxID=29078 RepID=UPI002403D4C5|nr:uncharacterized protein LOC129151736 [Eptesicus fuscus]